MRRKRLVSAGWNVGTGDQFLGLSRLESGLVSTKLALGDAVRSLRQRRRLSQETLAERMGSSQSRVAKLEDGAPGASLDLYLRALFSVHPQAQGDLAMLARRWSGARRLARDERLAKPAPARGGRHGHELDDLAEENRALRRSGGVRSTGFSVSRRRRTRPRRRPLA
ncbi:MAG: helix-turn-helix domain-containing protein [Deltaproteobacteria bacterium]